MENALCPPGVPCRIGWWNIPIPLRVVFFAIIAIGAAIMICGIVQRIKLWRQGQPELAFDRPLGAHVAHAEIRGRPGAHPAPTLSGHHALGDLLGHGAPLYRHRARFRSTPMSSS